MNNIISFNYFADVKRSLYDKEYIKLLPLINDAGVDTLWLFICNAGKYMATKDEIVKSKKFLESMGFKVNALISPVGHPGNSLNPEDDALDLMLPSHWDYRVLLNGEKEYFCACINSVLIEDNRKVVELCRDLGFEYLFFDDDLRMGAHGDEIRGCFCSNCLKEFSEIVGENITLQMLNIAIEQKNALSDKWIEYNCSKILKFMRETAVERINTGIMIMHNGGVNHGIDIKAIKQAVPNCIFRVGECHFDDVSFESDIDHKSERKSIKKHISAIGNLDVCYSETTVFPPNTLSPENLIKKIELAIAEGIYNIFLMSGTWVMTEKYWKAIAENRERLDILIK